MLEVNKYFNPRHEFYLNDIDFKRCLNEVGGVVSISVTDSLKADLRDEGVLLMFTRTLKFDPQAIFDLSVSFGAELLFNPDTKDEVDWNTFDLSDEFINNGKEILNNLASRTSLLISQITASFGQTPIITPPAFISQDS